MAEPARAAMAARRGSGGRGGRNGPGFTDAELKAGLAKHVQKAQEMQSITKGLRGMVSDLVSIRPGEEGEDELWRPEAGDEESKEYRWNPNMAPALVAANAASSSLLSPRQGHRHRRQLPTLNPSRTLIDGLSDASDTSNEEASTSDWSEGHSTVSAADVDTFDSEQWHGRVAELLGNLHATQELDAMESLHWEFENRKERRSEDVGALEGILDERTEDTAELLDEGSMGERVEMAHTALAGRLVSFNMELRNCLDEIRHQRAKAKKQKKVTKAFSFSGMKAYRAARKDEPSDPSQIAAGETRPQASSTFHRRRQGGSSTLKGPAALAQELLRSISGQQTQIADLQANSVIARKKLESHQATMAHLEACKNSDAKVAAPPDNVKEILHQCVHRWIVRGHINLALADGGGSRESDSAVRAEHGDSLHELEAEVEYLRQQVKELDEGVADLAGGGSRWLRRGSAEFAAAEAPARAARPAARGPAAAQPQAESSRSPSKEPLSRAVSKATGGVRKSQFDEVQLQQRSEQLQKELAAMEAKLAEVEAEHSTFMGSFTRAHHVWRRGNVVSSNSADAASFAAAVAALADGVAPSPTPSAAPSAKGREAEPPPAAEGKKPRRQENSPRRLPAAPVAAPPPARPPKDAATLAAEKAEAEEAEEALRQQAAWRERQARLAAAAGGAAPGGLGAGAEVLARQRREMEALEAQLQEAKEEVSVRMASTFPGAPVPSPTPASTFPGAPVPSPTPSAVAASSAAAPAAAPATAPAAAPAPALGSGLQRPSEAARRLEAAATTLQAAEAAKASEAEAVPAAASRKWSKERTERRSSKGSAKLVARLSKAQIESEKLNAELQNLQMQDELLQRIEAKEELEPEDVEKIFSTFDGHFSEDFRRQSLQSQIKEASQQVDSLRKSVAEKQQEFRALGALLPPGADEAADAVDAADAGAGASPQDVFDGVWDKLADAVSRPSRRSSW